MDKRFVRAVLKLRPDLREVSGHFYVAPVGHILRGYVFERTNHLAYVWHYSLPLYDRVDSISLTFGERLSGPEDTISVLDRDPSALAMEFVSKIRPYDHLLDALKDPAAFAEHVSSKKALENPRIRRGYAMTLVFLDRAAEAEFELTLLSRMRETAHYPHFHEDVNLVLEELKRGTDAAKGFLLRRESETKLRLGIEV